MLKEKGVCTGMLFLIKKKKNTLNAKFFNLVVIMCDLNRLKILLGLDYGFSLNSVTILPRYVFPRPS